MSDALKTSLGGLWVQPGGANKELYYLGCISLEDIDEPLSALELIQCFRPDGKGWAAKGTKESPPDPISTSLEQLVFPARNVLERIDSAFALYAMSRDGGRADNFVNYVRGKCMPEALKVNVSYAGIVNRLEDNESLTTYDVEGPDLLKFWEFDVEAQTVVQTENARDIAFSDIGNDRDGVCPDGVFSTDAVVLADLEVTANSGDTWTNAAANPFLIVQSALSVVRFMVDKTTVRTLMARIGVAAVLPEVAYSDDDGATWTNVVFPATSLGVVGQGAAKAGSLFALDAQHIWLCCTDAVAAVGGYIFFSSDGGATWIAQTQGTVVADELNAVHFSDENNGVCVSANDTVLTTTNGGASWIAGTATGGGNSLLCVHVLENRVWVGDDGGQLWYSDDFCVTWTERAGWVGSGVGAIPDIAFVNEYQGVMISNSAGPVGTILVTVNGGYTWQTLTTPANLGLTAIEYCNGALAYAVGLVDAGANAAVMKISA